MYKHLSVFGTNVHKKYITEPACHPPGMARNWFVYLQRCDEARKSKLFLLRSLIKAIYFTKLKDGNKNRKYF